MMLKTLTKKLRRHSLNEIHPFQLKISYHGSEEGGESDDSEEENQELAQIDRERRRNCVLTPLATSQQHNQGLLSPAHLRRLRLLLEPALDRHSSEEELERIAGTAGATVPDAGRKWSRHGDLSSASSDEEVKDLCEPPATRLRATSPGPVLFSSSPPRGLKVPPTGVAGRLVARPIILSHFEQPAMPYWRHRPTSAGEHGRPSLDLEKMQQKMLLKKNCGGKTRTIKIRNLNSSRHPPRYTYDPSSFAFHSLSTAPPRSPLLASEEPSCV
ncbi:uncharacterized protein si:dkey-16j16.4 isoform X1 [Electrophorus electricus]|uniref:Uncharacterized protein n=1 Tax=Electrophorus electricus TaxID=8005 RepID=A0A4W4EJU2_ELEEL|nr:uncharacterized protein si:dkey-16j16.4 isoform X1 [Electrophorus electricus]